MADVDAVLPVLSTADKAVSGSGVDYDDEDTLDGEISLKRPFVCGLCKEDFGKIETYYNHFKTHDLFISSMFHVCSEVCKGSSIDQVPGYTCSSCMFKFSSICLLHDHLLQCSKAGSYFYDHQQKAACPVEFCMFSNFRNEHGEKCNDVVAEDNDQTTEGDNKDGTAVVKEEQEDNNDNNENMKYNYVFDSDNNYFNENTGDDKQEVREGSGRKRKVIGMPKRLDESVANTMRKAILRTDEAACQANTKQSQSYGDTQSTNTKRRTRNKKCKSIKGSRLMKREKRMEGIERRREKSERRVEKNRQRMEKKEGRVKKKESRMEKKENNLLHLKLENNKPCDSSLEECVEERTSIDDDDGVDDNIDHDDVSDGDTEDSLDNAAEDNTADKNSAMKKKAFVRNSFAKRRSLTKSSNISRPRKRNSKVPTEEDFKCEICEKVFETVQECRVHSRSHRSCHICSKTYQHFRALRIHMRSHDDVQPFPCTICGRGFNEKRSLQSHMITHSDNKPFKCEVCSAAYKHPHTLKVHVRSHSKVMPFCCEVCGDGFVDWCTLKRHKIHKHTDERPFKCYLCGAGFKDNYKLTRHILTHSDVKLHQCEVCGRQMSTKSSLAVHMKKHRDREMYECSECSRKFVSKYILRDHQRTHSGEKPFKCPSCPKAHIKRAELRKHMLKHHDVDLDNMNIYPSRKHIIMGKVGTPDTPGDNVIRTKTSDIPINAAEENNFRSPSDVPMDLSFLSDVVDSAPQLKKGEQHDLSLMPT